MIEPERAVLLQTGFPSDPLLAFLLVLGVSLVPPLLFLRSLRNAERHRREPWSGVLRALAWGATVAVVIAITLELLLEPYADAFDPYVAVVSLATVVVAPVVEEGAKALGLVFVRDADPEPEDGFIYGGAVGFGFAATENLFYVGAALLLQGGEVAMITAVYRGLVTVALHGAVSAIAGYGVWRARYDGYGFLALGGIVLAILLHALYNALVSLSLPGATLFAAAGALVVFWRVRRRVRRMDAATPAA